MHKGILNITKGRRSEPELEKSMNPQAPYTPNDLKIFIFAFFIF